MNGCTRYLVGPAHGTMLVHLHGPSAGRVWRAVRPLQDRTLFLLHALVLRLSTHTIIITTRAGVLRGRPHDQGVGPEDGEGHGDTLRPQGRHPRPSIRRHQNRARPLAPLAPPYPHSLLGVRARMLTDRGITRMCVWQVSGSSTQDKSIRIWRLA
jgi:hypothetical protein